MLMAPEEDALSLKMRSDHLSHDLIIAPLWSGQALQAWLGTDR